MNKRRFFTKHVHFAVTEKKIESEKTLKRRPHTTKARMSKHYTNERKLQMIVQLISLVETNYERLEDARFIYTRSYHHYQFLKGNEKERSEFLRMMSGVDEDVGENVNLNHVLAILIPIIFSHPHARDDLLTSMKAIKYIN